MPSYLTQRLRILADIRRLLNDTLSYQDAVDTIRRRLERRDERFLRVVHDHIFENPHSPYLRLLRHAGCEYGDLTAEVGRHGVEGALLRLRDAGVWIGFEEFKGRRPLERPGLSFLASPKDFDNPRFDGAGLAVSTGGSSGPSIYMRVACDFLRERAPYEHLMARMIGGHETPIVMWLPRLPASSGLMFALMFAHCGFAPRHWFAIHTSGNLRMDWLTNLVAATSRLTRNPLPWPKSLSGERADAVLDCILENLASGAGGCVVRVYVSGAIRICQEAERRGESLEHVTFMVGGEPATPSRMRLIEASGARAFSRYQSTEAGSISLGCGDQRGIADHHLNLDTMAVIQEDGPPGEPRPFLITSLIHSAPKILLNVEQGDSCVLDERRCGCPADALGLRTHMTQVSSYVRATTEGMALPFALLSRLAEEDLPARFGGHALQYQWVENEDHGASRWRLRIDPALGPIEDRAVLRFVYDTLGDENPGVRLQAEVWRTTNAIRIAREVPEITARGKTFPVLRKGAVRQFAHDAPNP